MKNHFLFLFILTLSFQSFSQSIDSIQHDGYNRTYFYHIPQDYSGDEAWPMVFVLHGGGQGNGDQMYDLLQFDEIAEFEDYLVVFPNGVFSDWADGRGVTDSEMAGVDDVGFLTTLVDSLKVKWLVDERRVYVTGASNGGMMTQRLACEANHKFAAFATIIASMSDPLASNCQPGRAIPMLLMNGTEDNWVPYDGGPLGTLTDGGSVVGTDSTINFWLANNNCLDVLPEIEELPNLNMNDNSTITFSKYEPCPEDTEIQLFSVVGGGHTIPGGLPLINPIPLLGYVNRDIIGANRIWNFFKNHQLPENFVASEEIAKAKDQFNLYPNPATELINITSSQATTFEIAIFDSKGTEIRNSLILNDQKTTSIEIGDLSEGFYFVRIETAERVVWKTVVLN